MNVVMLHAHDTIINQAMSFERAVASAAMPHGLSFLRD